MKSSHCIILIIFLIETRLLATGKSGPRNEREDIFKGARSEAAKTRSLYLGPFELQKRLINIKPKAYFNLTNSTALRGKFATSLQAIARRVNIPSNDFENIITSVVETFSPRVNHTRRSKQRTLFDVSNESNYPSKPIRKDITKSEIRKRSKKQKTSGIRRYIVKSDDNFKRIKIKRADINAKIKFLKKNSILTFLLNLTPLWKQSKKQNEQKDHRKRKTNNFQSIKEFFPNSHSEESLESLEDISTNGSTTSESMFSDENSLLHEYLTVPLYKLFGPPYDHYRAKLFGHHKTPISTLHLVQNEPQVRNYAVPPSLPPSTKETIDSKFTNHSVRKTDSTQPTTLSIASTPNPVNTKAVLRKFTIPDTLPLTPHINSSSLETESPMKHSLDLKTLEMFSNLVDTLEMNNSTKREKLHLKNQINENFVNHSTNNLEQRKSSKTEENVMNVNQKEYPFLSDVPETSFTCLNRLPGMYADYEAKCQVWHTCEADKRHHVFLCPNGTLFNQLLLTCDWWYNVECRIPEMTNSVFNEARGKSHDKNGRREKEETLNINDTKRAVNHFMKPVLQKYIQESFEQEDTGLSGKLAITQKQSKTKIEAKDLLSKRTSFKPSQKNYQFTEFVSYAGHHYPIFGQVTRDHEREPQTPRSYLSNPQNGSAAEGKI